MCMWDLRCLTKKILGGLDDKMTMHCAMSHQIYLGLKRGSDTIINLYRKHNHSTQAWYPLLLC